MAVVLKIRRMATHLIVGKSAPNKLQVLAVVEEHSSLLILVGVEVVEDSRGGGTEACKYR